VVVAVDGPGGVGKSTVARAVAAELGISHLDTGATYRAATLAVIEAGVDVSDIEAVLGVVAPIAIDYIDGVVILDGEDVTSLVRRDAVNAIVSTVSAISEVRSRIVAMQRGWVGRQGGRAVVEGRDIGTVVFPRAPVKVFMTARPEVRAARRARDAEAADKGVAEIAVDLHRRDHIDSTRVASPLRPAEDAVVVDTSEMTVDDVVRVVLDLVERVGRTPSSGTGP
jgi:cytidylate kinase